MPEIKAMKQFFGATVNDVILSLVTATFRRYVELHGTHVQGRLLRIVVPVNVRGTAEAQKLGNQITFLPVAIPLDVRDPQELVAAVRERMAFLKSIHLAEAVGMAGTLISSVPTTVQALAGPYASLLPVSFCNLICTNVPGPQMPLYLLGHKMLSMYPYVPIGGEMGINCAILTYNGVAYIGFIGDTHAAPDLHRLEDCLKESLEEMRRSIPVRIPRPERKVTPRPKAKPKRKAASVKRRPEKTAQGAAAGRGNGVDSGSAVAPSPNEIRLGVGA
jgi:diacylglycerol O-acyltransferase